MPKQYSDLSENKGGEVLEGCPRLTVDEQERLLVTWNETRAAYPDQLCLHHLFEQQVARTPDAIAVEYEQEQLTYAQLNKVANQLAHVLQRLGVGPEVLVGVSLQRSLPLIIGIMGILKAGGAYVPLEPAYPRQRLVSLVEDAHISLLLTNSSLRETLPAVGQVVCLDQIWSAMLSSDGEKSPSSPTCAENLAYVLYTSGSTGQPKGVMIAHQGVVHYVDWSSKYYGVASGSGSAVHSSLSFDLTVTSLFPALVIGRRVVLVPEAPGMESLSQMVRQKRGLSVLKMTPAHLDLLGQTLAPGEFAAVANALVIGGEALQGESVRAWREHAPATRIINEYGPTETVVGCCIYEIPRDEALAGAVSIGRPLPNTQLYVLDAYLCPVPVGVAGELYIGGVGLGRGYLHRPDLTAERFIANPFGSEPGTRLYKTGDSVRYRPDGTLEYLGRLDQQVKVRGYRVELGEIEATIRAHPTIQEAAVQARHEPATGTRLVAYVVRQPGAVLSGSELRAFLQERLPAYMLPWAFVFLESLPLTPNGKVDRQALLAMAVSSGQEEREYMAPRTEVEAQLAQIWAQLLGIERVSVQANFFDLGGHSLLAAQVIGRIQTVFQVGLSQRHIFNAPTIAELANVIVQQQNEQKDVPFQEIQKLDRGNGMPSLEQIDQLSDEEIEALFDSLELQGDVME